MVNDPSRPYSLDLFVDQRPLSGAPRDLHWPEVERFPLNRGAYRVGAVVQRDLRSATDPLLVAGYAGLDQIIELVAGCAEPRPSFRILIGSEPFPSRHEAYRLDGSSLPREVESYWLGRGISLLLSAKLILLIDLLKGGRIEARCLTASGARLHAKIYCGDEAITVGSSNFTRPGLEYQHEANVRFLRTRDPKRYQELRQIAENFWAMGHDYRDELIALLEKLLRLVGWREALARACAELLEGEWAREYMREDLLPAAGELWPSQRQGIAQALYVLAHQGSILIADATGSGKTRMGAYLVRAIRQQILGSGRLRQGVALMVCPPAVEKAWKVEAEFCGAYLKTHSHGTLSHARSGHHDLSAEGLRRAQVLCVDEGHNFLNVNSNRTRQLLRNMADHVVLFTATPINRSVTDLLRIADMLGADNLAPSTLRAFKRMLGARRIDRTLTDEDLGALRREIQRFTLRRTKGMLNALIDRDPERYRDARGECCRFPKHRPRIYPLGEPPGDRQLAARVRQLAGTLHGVTHFRKPLELPAVLKRKGWSEEKYLTARLRSATKLSRYVVMAALRSSCAALIEHVAGTREAAEAFDLGGFRRGHESGNMLGRIDELSGPPENRLRCALTDWLWNEDAHAQACAHDRGVYTEIQGLVDEMSDHRERTKAAKLIDLAARHGLVLAFDSRPITLHYLERKIHARAKKLEVLIATGDPGSQRARVLETFAPGSKVRRTLGLCSDSLAEGVNLQQARCMVHLDMPSVVRVAEQRVGRVDRMDSPHPEIEAWWPDDAPEFALSSDERFIERYETVEALLGSNLPLPDTLQRYRAAPVDAQRMIKDFEKQTSETHWDEIQDAFEPVRALVMGEKSIVGNLIYQRYRKLGARVLARVSLVPATSPWAFFCVAAGAGGAPHWVLFPSERGDALTQLTEVSAALRERLNGGIDDLGINRKAQAALDYFLARLGRAERELLSRKKQRALDEMEIILDHFMRDAARSGCQRLVERYQALLHMIRTPNVAHQPDWNAAASRWLDLIRPVWYQRLKHRRVKPLLLKDIRKDILALGEPFGAKVLEEFRTFPLLPPPDERIIACIVGVA